MSEEEYAGDMGGRQAAREAALEAARLQAEADTLASRINPDDYGDGPTQEPDPRNKPPPDTGDDDYGPDPPLVVEPVVEEEEEVEEEDEPDYGGGTTHTPITQEDIVYNPDENDYESANYVHDVLGVALTPSEAEVAQMGYDSPQYVPPEENPLLKDIREYTTENDTKFTLEKKFGEDYAGVSGEVHFDWVTDTTDLQKASDRIVEIDEELHEIQDPEANGFVKVMLDPPIQLTPETESYDGTVTPATFQTYTWEHETVIAKNKEIEKHNLINPLNEDNIKEGWTIGDATDPITGVKIQALWDHDDDETTAEIPLVNEEGEPVYVQTVIMPPAAKHILNAEIAEAEKAEAAYIKQVEEFTLEMEKLDTLKEKIDFWNSFMVEKEVPILDDEGKDTGKTETKQFFTGNVEQYGIYKGLVDDYTEIYTELTETQDSILGGYNPEINKLDEDGNTIEIKPPVDADGDGINDLVQVQDFTNPLRGLVFTQVEEGEGKYIKNANGDFIEDANGIYNVKTNVNTGLPFENLWTKYFTESDDANLMSGQLNDIANKIADDTEDWNKIANILGSEQNVNIKLYHSMEEPGGLWDHDNNPDTPNVTFEGSIAYQLSENTLPAAVVLLEKRQAALGDFDTIRGSLMEGNDQFIKQLGQWNKDAMHFVQDKAAWNTLQLNRQAIDAPPDTNLNPDIYDPSKQDFSWGNSIDRANMIKKAHGDIDWSDPKHGIDFIPTTKDLSPYDKDTPYTPSPMVLTTDNWRDIAGPDTDIHTFALVANENSTDYNQIWNIIKTTRPESEEKAVPTWGGVFREKMEFIDGRWVIKDDTATIGEITKILKPPEAKEEAKEDTTLPNYLEGLWFDPTKDSKPVREEVIWTFKVGDKVIIEQPKIDDTQFNAPDWATDEDGRFLPGYHSGMSKQDFMVETKHLDVDGKDYTKLSFPDKLQFLAEEWGLLSPGEDLIKYQPAINFAGKWGASLAYKENGEWISFDENENPATSLESILRIGAQTVIVNHDTGEISGPGDESWVETDTPARKIYLGNIAATTVLYVAQNPDESLERKSALMTLAGAAGSVENIVRINPTYKPWHKGNVPTYTDDETGNRVWNLPIRFGEEKITDMFQAYGGGATDVIGFDPSESPPVWTLKGFKPWKGKFPFIPSYTGIVEPNWHEIFETSGRVPGLGFMGTIADTRGENRDSRLYKDAPGLSVVHAGELVGKGYQRIGFDELGSLYGKDADILIPAYMTGSAVAEFGIDKVAAKLIGLGLKGGLKLLTKTHAPQIIKGSTRFAGKNIVAPVVSVMPKTVQKGAMHASHIATQAVQRPGSYLPLGSVFDFSDNMGKVFLAGTKQVLRPINTVFGKDFLSDVKVLTPRFKATTRIHKPLSESFHEPQQVYGATKMGDIDIQTLRQSNIADPLFDRWRSVDTTDLPPVTFVGKSELTASQIKKIADDFAQTRETTIKSKIREKQLLPGEEQIEAWQGSPDYGPFARFAVGTVSPAAGKAGRAAYEFGTIGFQRGSEGLSLGLQYGKQIAGQGRQTATQFGSDIFDSMKSHTGLQFYDFQTRLGGFLSDRYKDYSSIFGRKGGKTGDTGVLSVDRRGMKYDYKNKEWVRSKPEVRSKPDTGDFDLSLQKSDIRLKDDIVPYKQDDLVPSKKIPHMDELSISPRQDNIVPYRDTEEIIPYRDSDVVPISYRDPEEIIPPLKKKTIPDSGRPKDTPITPYKAKDADVTPYKKPHDLPTPYKKIDDPMIPYRDIDEIVPTRIEPPTTIKKIRPLDDFDVHFKKTEFPSGRFRNPIPLGILSGLGLAGFLGSFRGRGGGGVGMRGTYGGRGSGHTLKRDIKDLTIFGKANFLNPESMDGFFQSKSQPKNIIQPKAQSQTDLQAKTLFQPTVKKQQPLTTLRGMVKKTKGGAFY